MRGVVAVVMSCVALACAKFATAQAAPAVREDSLAERRACDSVLAKSVVDSQRVVVRLTTRRSDGGVFPSPYPELTLQEVAFRFQPPRPLRLPVLSPGPIEMRSMRAATAGQTGLREPVLNGLYGFAMHRDGRVSRLEVLVPTRAPGLDSAMMDALASSGAEKAMPFPLDELAEDSIALQVRLTSVYAGNDPSLELFTSYFPRLSVVDASRIGPDPVAEFPAEERKAGMFGDVRFQVIVDNSGSPDLATLEVLRAPTLGFAISAVKALGTMRWNAARVGSCVAPQMVHVNVRFDRPDTANVP